MSNQFSPTIDFYAIEPVYICLINLELFNGLLPQMIHPTIELSKYSKIALIPWNDVKEKRNLTRSIELSYKIATQR